MASIFSYAKTLWQDGVTAITAARLNHIEQGISDAADSIKTLGDSVSRKSETVSSQYGNAIFYSNGSVCTVVCDARSDIPFKTYSWIEICTVPKWLNVQELMGVLFDGGGVVIGDWRITDKSLQILVHSEQCKMALVKGIAVCL